ncbi:uncharacterized protein [Typha angustifolia]|uniref:uncharacterized protein n=1 Tax=Typha angustifolia TaxID=59011 RepID=UPI003C2E9F9E
MKLKEGRRVEVFRRDEDPYGSWFPATVVLSAHRCKFTVRYELLLTAEGDPLVEKVHKEDVRPHPPCEQRKKRWICDDIAEVFDICSWRTGKIVKVLRNHCFVIKLFGSIQLKAFHISGLRERKVWLNDQWVGIEKVNGKKQHDNHTSPISESTAVSLGCGAAHMGTYEEACTDQRWEKDHVGQITHAKKSKNCFTDYSLLPDYLVSKASKRRKLSEDMLPENCFPRFSIGKNNSSNEVMHSSFIPLNAIKESECSVASCSGSNFHEYTNKDREKSIGIAIYFSDDAMSACPYKSENKGQSHSEDEVASNIHLLELQAYQSTVQAFYALGPLSWEQESLLTNLRLSLNISNEEHLLQLRHLLSA